MRCTARICAARWTWPSGTLTARTGEQFKWTSETTILTEDFLRHASASEIERLQKLHQAGLIDFGGMYCNLTPLATTELLARSLLVVAALRRDYGLTSATA